MLYCMLVQSDPSSSSWTTLDLVVPGGDHGPCALGGTLTCLEHATISLHHVQPTTLVQLGNVLTEEWDNLEMAATQRLIGSTRRRCQAVIASRGSHTKY